MSRLIKADLASTGKPHLRNGTPSRFLNLRALNVLLREGSHFGFQIVAHEIDFLGATLIGRVDCGFCLRQCEDQPAVTRIHRCELENVAEKCSVRLGVFYCRQLRELQKSFACSLEMPAEGRVETNRCGGALPRVNGSLFDETKGISPWVLGIERSLAPRAHDDATSRCIVNFLARQTVQRLGAVECCF